MKDFRQGDGRRNNIIIFLVHNETYLNAYMRFLDKLFTLVTVRAYWSFVIQNKNLNQNCVEVPLKYKNKTIWHIIPKTVLLWWPTRHVCLLFINIPKKTDYMYMLIKKNILDGDFVVFHALVFFSGESPRSLDRCISSLSLAQFCHASHTECLLVNGLQWH